MNKKPASKSNKSEIPLRVAVMGVSNWLSVLCELLRRAGMSCEELSIIEKCSFIKWFFTGRWLRFRIVRNFDAVHYVGGAIQWRAGLMCTLFGRKPVWHWIGTDVLNYRKARGSLRGFLYYLCARFCSRIHLADSPELAEELRELGISANVVRLLPKLIEAEAEPLPERFTVLSYWWDGRRKLYGGDIILKLAEEFPAIDFVILGATGKDEPVRENVQFMGLREDIASFYSKSSVFIRIPIHDSLSAMVLEMLARGRYVIYNKPMEGVHFADDIRQAREALKDIMEKNEPNYTGAAMVKDRYSLDKEAARLESYYHDL